MQLHSELNRSLPDLYETTEIGKIRTGNLFIVLVGEGGGGGGTFVYHREALIMIL